MSFVSINYWYNVLWVQPFFAGAQLICKWCCSSIFIVNYYIWNVCYLVHLQKNWWKTVKHLKVTTSVSLAGSVLLNKYFVTIPFFIGRCKYINYDWCSWQLHNSLAYPMLTSQKEIKLFGKSSIEIKVEVFTNLLTPWVGLLGIRFEVGWGGGGKITPFCKSLIML